MLAIYFLATALACLVASLSPVDAYERASLDGSDWTVRNTNGSITIPATVPGVIHLDLLRAGLIDEPYYRFNEVNYRWIAYQPYWSFTKLFTPPQSLFGHDALELVFDGIDTVANVTLNGRLLATTNNQFRRLVIPLTTTLLSPRTVNNLTVTIASPVLYAQHYYDRYPYELPVSDPTSEIPYRNFIRKAQSAFGWDWGGGFAPSGVWKHVELRAYDEAVLVDATFVATPLTNESSAANVWLVNVTAYLRVAHSASPLSALLTTSVAGVKGSIQAQLTAPANPYDGDALSVVSILSVVYNPSLWWPVDYGNATLHQLAITYTGPATTDTLHRQVGFRTIRVVREATPADQPGRSMYFEVNGVPVYAKGSNLVPFDTFYPRITPSAVKRMLDSARLSHQNIIRIWGGGIFQSDDVYNYADQHGILIWQEFLFACAMYPVDHDFLTNVREEVSQAVRRLVGHASLAIFGGNNENEAMLNWQPETEGLNRDRYLIDENELYVNTVRDALVREVGVESVEFQSSSPSNGPFSLEPYTLYWGNAYDDNYGDNHWYNYDADCSDVTVFPRSRFISEFGWQSMPSLYTWQQISQQSDWQYRSNLSLFRQHHDGGYDQMEASIRRYFNFPNATDGVQLFNDTLYMTQVQQAYCYSQAIHHWRRIKQETPGNTMGAIYWQMNDEWQAPTWASLEVRARWKILHYTIRQVFTQNLVSGYVNPIHSPSQARLGVYLVSDSVSAQRVSVAINLRHWSSGDVVQRVVVGERVLEGLQAVRVYNESLMALIGSASEECTPVTNCYVQLQWLTAGNTSSGVEHNVMLGSLAPAPLVNPHLTLDVTSTTPSTITTSPPSSTKRHTAAAHSAAATPQLAATATIIVRSSAPAAWVFVETAVEGWFSDNGFVLLPDAPRTLTFTGYEAFNVSELTASLNVRSVWDVTHRD